MTMSCFLQVLYDFVLFSSCFGNIDNVNTGNIDNLQVLCDNVLFSSSFV